MVGATGFEPATACTRIGPGSRAAITSSSQLFGIFRASIRPSRPRTSGDLDHQLAPGALRLEPPECVRRLLELVPGVDHRLQLAPGEPGGELLEVPAPRPHHDEPFA